jgi:hypothetical protein
VWSKAGLDKSVRAYLKNKLKANGLGVTQVIEHLTSKHKALISILSTNPLQNKVSLLHHQTPLIERHIYRIIIVNQVLCQRYK